MGTSTPPGSPGHRKDHFNANGWCICICPECLTGGLGIRIRCTCPACPCNTGKKVTR